MKHPIQPIITTENGVKRFKENPIVSYLLDHGGIDLNDLAGMDFSAADREHFAQLIGYSLSGFSELSYVSDDTFEAAEKMAESGLTEDQARIEALTEKLDAIREALKVATSTAFRIHPDDLKA